MYIEYFYIPSNQIENTYNHKRNDRFAMIQGNGKWFEIDKDLMGVEDHTNKLFGWAMYDRKKPNGMFKHYVIESYLDIYEKLEYQLKKCFRYYQDRNNYQPSQGP